MTWNQQKNRDREVLPESWKPNKDLRKHGNDMTHTTEFGKVGTENRDFHST